MGLMCTLGMHKWDGCKCSVCSRTRDAITPMHDCAPYWDGDKCAICGKPRSQEHNCASDWDGCRCSKCGKTRDAEHTWDGCKCTRCGKTRDAEHSWDGCKCTKCGKENHSWDGCKCTKCGKTRAGGHSWDGCKCTTCGKTRVAEHSQDGNLTGLTVVVAAYSLVEPYRSLPEKDRCFFCVNKSAYGGWYDGFWVIDGTRGTTGAFVIEKVLQNTPNWIIQQYPAIARIAR